MIRHMILEDQRSPGRSNASSRDQILHRHRDAVQRAELRTLHDGGFSVPRRRHRHIPSNSDERVQRRLAALDALERVAHHLDGRNRSLADLNCQLGG